MAPTMKRRGVSRQPIPMRAFAIPPRATAAFRSPGFRAPQCGHAFARDDTEPLHSQHFVIPIVASERPLAVEGSGPIQGRSRPLLCSRRHSIRSHLAHR